MVNWKHICAPKSLGGLGIKDLRLFSKELRLRWLLFDSTDANRPWHGLPLPINHEDLLLFQACTEIKLGNGSKALFWKDPWLDGAPLQERFPTLFKLA
jgi:hypothetical protein